MKRYFICVIMLIFSSRLFSIDWPLVDKQVVSTFGSNRGGQFLIGLAIAGKDDSVVAAEDGEIIFTAVGGNCRGKLPSGLGDFVVLQHEDGLKSIYTHLQGIAVKDNEKEAVAEGERIGTMGDTGWTYGRHLGFIILDSEFNQFVNPLLVLPTVVDTNKPVVENLRFQYGDTEIDIDEGSVIPAGRYNLLADVYDISQYTLGLNAMAPFSVTVFLNGSEMNRYTFEALQEVEKNIILRQSEGKGYSEIYAGERTINLGKYDIIPGNISIEIIAADYEGNEISVIYNVLVSG